MGMNHKIVTAKEKAERKRRVTDAPSESSASPACSKRLSPYQKIMRAAVRGTGVRLTPDDVARLSIDPAITDAAINDGDGYKTF